MALGASFHGANYSHSFRVRDIMLSDGYNYEFKGVITNLDSSIKKDDKGYINKEFTLFNYKK